MMTEQFSVMLRTVTTAEMREIGLWIGQHTTSFEKCNTGELVIGPTYDTCRKERISFTFTNDTDAMLFRLTFSQYL